MKCIQQKTSLFPRIAFGVVGILKIETKFDFVLIALGLFY
jgi:hypothetical protein